MQFKFKKKTNIKLAMEEIRSMFHAVVAVLEYHNLKFTTSEIEVSIVESIGVNSEGSKIAGQADQLNNNIELVIQDDWQDTLTIVLHEMLHLAGYQKEKVTSTLTAKLKTDVAKIAKILLENTYQRAAFKAHAKISYRPQGADHYDDSQFNEVDVNWEEKYRKKNIAL